MPNQERSLDLGRSGAEVSSRPSNWQSARHPAPGCDLLRFPVTALWNGVRAAKNGQASHRIEHDFQSFEPGETSSGYRWFNSWAGYPECYTASETYWLDLR